MGTARAHCAVICGFFQWNLASHGNQIWHQRFNIRYHKHRLRSPRRRRHRAIQHCTKNGMGLSKSDYEGRRYRILSNGTVWSQYASLVWWEGKSFLRLQEEIMKISDDHSLFAWATPVSYRSLYYNCGLLASSPANFSKSHNIVPLLHNDIPGSEIQAPYFMINRGISISLTILQLPISLRDRTDNLPKFLATLDCQDKTDTRSPLNISLPQWTRLL